ncbi:MAG TPA: paraquat-inducible protein A [Opitutaceae bacterium]|jgi:hypothetical protein
MSTSRFALPGLVLLTAAYFIVAGACGFRVAVHEVETSHLIDQVASRQDLNHVTNADVNLNPSKMGVVTSFFLRISQKDIVTRQQAAENQHEIVDEIGQLKAEIRASTGDSVLLIAFTIIYLLIAVHYFEGDRSSPFPQIYALLAVSLIFFAIGISCPVLTAVVKGEHMLIGGFIIETASKGIISTVVSLFKSGSWYISVLLAGFSIGIPIFKGIAVLATSVSRSRDHRLKMGRALESIGKWSLTDVLVAAVLLGCFSLNAIQESDGGVYAVPRFALGFFIFYCVLAARTSFLLRRTGESKTAQASHPSRAVALVSSAIVTLALAAGTALGATLHWDLPFSYTVSEPALIKLIRTHTELVNRKFHAGAGRETAVPMDLPFSGVLMIELKVGGDSQVSVHVEREAVDHEGQPVPGPAEPVPEYQSPPVSHYVRSARLPAGKYQLVLEGARAAFLGSATVTVHASLDP